MTRAKRITPADAGNSFAIKFIHSVIRDHPRGCGEQMALRCADLRHSGSPPRMRGTGSNAIIGGFSCGITPADAGNSVE